MRNQAGVEKHRFVNNGAQLESQIEQEQEERGRRTHIQSPWLIELPPEVDEHVQTHTHLVAYNKHSKTANMH